MSTVEVRLTVTTSRPLAEGRTLGGIEIVYEFDEMVDREKVQQVAARLGVQAGVLFDKTTDERQEFFGEDRTQVLPKLADVIADDDPILDFEVFAEMDEELVIEDRVNGSYQTDGKGIMTIREILVAARKLKGLAS